MKLPHPDYDFVLYEQLNSPPVVPVVYEKISGTLFLGSYFFKPSGKIARAPFLYVYDYPLYKTCNHVTVDIEPCIKTLVIQLLQSGCKELGWFGWQDSDGINYQKLKFLEKYAGQYGLSFRNENKITQPNLPFSYMAGYNRLRQVCTGKHPVDALVLFSDQCFQPVIRAIYDSRKSIPQDIRLVSFDNLKDSPFMIPSLTTVEMDRNQLGRMAVRQLIQAIEHPEDVPLNVNIPARIIYRESFPEPERQKKEKSNKQHSTPSTKEV